MAAKAREVRQEWRTLGTTAGGSTYMITLPKGWVDELHLQKGDTLQLVRVDSGIYLCRGREREASSARTQLAVNERVEAEALERALISLYIAGFDVIEVVGQISEEQRAVIRHTAQRLIGEILQEKENLMLVQALRDPQVLSVPQLLEYIDENAEEMLKDALEALVQGDFKKTQRVVERDERVDRFFLRLSRQLYAALRDPLAEVERGISRVDFFNTHIVARQLERVADHAVKIALEAQALLREEKAFPKRLTADLTHAKDQVENLLRQVMRAFVNLDGEEAHQVLAKRNAIEEWVKALDSRLLELEDSHMTLHLGSVVDSIRRVKEYASNIAEVALNAEALLR